MLRVTADDYGLSAAVSRGIRAAHRQGIVTHTSIMANMPQLGDEIAALQSCPDLICGIHVTLTEGRPVSDAGAVFADETGFMTKKSFLRAYLRGPTRVGQAAYEEMRAQCARLQTLEVALQHLDGHHHVHVFPAIQGAVLRVAQEFGISQLRASHDRDFLRMPAYWPIYWWSRRFACRARAAGFVVAEHFCGGLFLQARDDEKPSRLQELLVQYSAQDAELYCHPGEHDTSLRDAYQAGRAAEMRALIDARKSQ